MASHLFELPFFVIGSNEETNTCRQNIGITPSKKQNLFKIWFGGTSGGFCFAKSEIKYPLERKGKF